MPRYNVIFHGGNANEVVEAPNKAEARKIALARYRAALERSLMLDPAKRKVSASDISKVKEL